MQRCHTYKIANIREVNRKVKFLRKFKKKKIWGCQIGGWSQGGCEQRIEVFVKIQKKYCGGGGGGGRCRVWVVRVDVIEELKFLKKLGGGGQGGWVGREGSGWGGQGGCDRRSFWENSQKKNSWGGGQFGGGGGVGLGGGGVRVNVNEELKFL